jgi:sulfur carrier protein
MVNGDEQMVDQNTTVGALVDSLGRGRAGIAIARNAEIVPRSQWDTEVLQAGDRVEVVTAAQGG